MAQVGTESIAPIVDSGAISNIISKPLLDFLTVKTPDYVSIWESKEKVVAELANGSQCPLPPIVAVIFLTLSDGRGLRLPCRVLPHNDHVILIGLQALYQYQSRIDFQNQII